MMILFLCNVIFCVSGLSDCYTIVQIDLGASFSPFFLSLIKTDHVDLHVFVFLLVTQFMLISSSYEGFHVLSSIDILCPFKSSLTMYLSTAMFRGKGLHAWKIQKKTTVENDDAHLKLL